MDDNENMDRENMPFLPGMEQEEYSADSQENVQLPEDDGGDSLRNFFADCFVQYASYVVRDRAIPDVDDGLKPVQRRILYCMHQVDDGRYNKVAGVVGDTMHYHPHGDASIFGALTVLANKEFFIDRQGNFGNIFTGMAAAAPRYIECRLTELAKETMFNSEITEFVETYDGRRKEPVRLPAKVPSLLMHGSSGIAVGMATHIFPHNFKELLDAEIAVLKGEPFQILPDFQQGALMDASEYEDGAGKIRVRARIEADGDKKLVIREIPPGTTTDSLIASIEAAAKRNKVKIASINDYTAENVCIEISMQRGVYAEETLKQLYAYTDCQREISSDLLVICENTPMRMKVSDILRRNVEKLTGYLKQELELAIHQLQEKILEKTLAQIFVEYKIYKKIEKCGSLELIMKETRDGLLKYKELYHREITDQDIEKILQIPIRRISAFDISRNEQEIAKLNSDKQEKEHQLLHLVEYTVAYLQNIADKYAVHFPRRTEIAAFDSVDVKAVARRDVKVYFDRQGHFIGTKVKPSNKEASPLVLTEFDKITVIRTDGGCKVMDIPEREYVGLAKYLLPANKSQIYCILYRDKTEGTWYVKRFRIGQYILGKEYRIIPPNCEIKELYTNYGVVLSLDISSRTRRSSKNIEVDFSKYPLRSREVKGFKLTSFNVTAIKVINKGTENPPENTAGETVDDEAVEKPEDVQDLFTNRAQQEEVPETHDEAETPQNSGDNPDNPGTQTEKKQSNRLIQGSFFFDE